MHVHTHTHTRTNLLVCASCCRGLTSGNTRTFPCTSFSLPLSLIHCIIHARKAETPSVISSYGFSRNVFAASLLILGLGGSFLPCCLNDNHRGGEAKHRRGFWLYLLLTLCNAVCYPPPPITTTISTNPAKLPSKSAPVPFQLRGAAWVSH